MKNSNFARLIGMWKTEGTVFIDNQNLKLVGSDSYEFILDGTFILHKADVKIGDEKSETFEIIASEGSDEKGEMRYYNSKGETGVMTSSFVKNHFIIIGDKIKFDGIINEENFSIIGKWSLQAAGGWTDLMDIRLTKQ